jgi:hypothetical protein
VHVDWIKRGLSSDLTPSISAMDHDSTVMSYSNLRFDTVPTAMSLLQFERDEAYLFREARGRAGDDRTRCTSCEVPVSSQCISNALKHEAFKTAKLMISKRTPECNEVRDLCS